MIRILMATVISSLALTSVALAGNLDNGWERKVVDGSKANYCAVETSTGYGRRADSREKKIKRVNCNKGTFVVKSLKSRDASLASAE